MSNLPPLPPEKSLFTLEEPIYSEDQMREYGQRCHYCDELVHDTTRWCNVWCRDLWEKAKCK